MSTNHNRIKVADLETNQPNKILKTNQNGELEFTDATNLQTETYNALDCTTEGKALDARQGKVLKEMIDNKESVSLVNDLTTGGTTEALTAEMGKKLNEIKANLGSPAFTDIPTAPTALAGTNTTQIATTEFVKTTVNNLPIPVVQDVSAIQSGIVNNTELQELGGVDKLINGVRIGKGAGNVDSNTVLGFDSLTNNSGGSENIAIGFQSGKDNTEGSANIFIGVYTGTKNTTGNDNTVIGAGALMNNVSGNNNTIIGSLTGKELVTANGNTLIGRPDTIAQNATNLIVLSDGVGNEGIRKEADNRLIAPTLTNGLIDAGGNKSLITKEYLMPQLASKLTATIATDAETQINSSVPEDNKIVSRSKLYNWWNSKRNQSQMITSWYLNDPILLGTPIAPTAVKGTNTTQIATTEFVKTALNNFSISTIKDASPDQAGVVNNTSLQELGGTDKTINGVRIGRGGGNMMNSTAVGSLALYFNTTGSANTAVGFIALYKNTTGDCNIAYGGQALYSNTTGGGNTACGHSSLMYNETGYNNTALGYRSLEKSKGSKNIGIGNEAGVGIVNGNNNTIIGNYSGNTSDSNLVVLGDGSGNIAIKKEADNRLLAPTLTNTLIDAGGNQSLVTLGYFKTNSAVNVVGIYPDNATALSNGKKVGDVYRKATGELMIVF